MHMERIPETFYPPHPQRNIETEVVTAQRGPREEIRSKGCDCTEKTKKTDQESRSRKTSSAF